MKIVIVGAGSTSFGAGMMKDILQADELKNYDGLTVALVDTDNNALGQITQLAERMKNYTGSNATIMKTTDRKEAFESADYIISAVEVARMPLWEQDFRVPLAYGFKHVLGENGGPGALFHSLRSLNQVIPICQDVEQICPDALFLNFTNPESRVLHGICHLTKVKAVGLCHGIFMAKNLISKYLNRPLDELHIISAGLNHFFSIQSVVDKLTGKELIDILLDKVISDDSPDTPPLFKKMVEIFGMFSIPSDDHVGEYVSFGSEYSGVKWPYGQEHKPVTTSSPAKIDLVSQTPLDEDYMQPTGELAIPIICDIEFNHNCIRDAVNVINNDGYIPNLPLNAAIEVPATVDKKGIHPMTVQPIKEPVAAMMRTQCSINALVTEAFRTGSKKLLLQALLLDPVVNNISAAEALLDDMLELQKEYLPVFSGD